MRWTTLHVLGVQEYYPKALKARIETLNSTIDKLLKERTAFDNALTKAQEQLPATVDFDNLLCMPGQWRAEKLLLLRKELVARREAHEVRQEMAAAALKESEVQHGRHEELKESVRQKLIALGYHDFQGGEPDPCMLKPGWLLAHPDVRAAYDNAEAFHNQGSNGTGLPQNDVAIKAIEEEMRKVQASALAVD